MVDLEYLVRPLGQATVFLKMHEKNALIAWRSHSTCPTWEKFIDGFVMLVLTKSR
ncbi:MAG: hypothetical protein HQL78_03005 [Magnetococcales bacterium]|nr:hypothetical protein [Magnetococcales bacterium]